MKTNIKKIAAIITLVSVVCLNACSDNSVKENATTTTNAPETTASVEQTTENLSRVVEVPYEDEYSATFTFNEKGLLVSSEKCPWGADNNYYKYDEQNRIIEIQHALWDGTIDEGCERRIYTYDEEGNLSDFTIYTGPKDKLVRFRVYSYEYNNGLLIKETQRAGGNNEIIETTDYEYNDNGKIIRETTQSSYGTVRETLYEYDSKGNNIKRVTTNENEKSIELLTYNENGNCISSEHTEYNGETTAFKNSYKYEYNNDGDVIKEYFTQIRYNAEGEKEEEISTVENHIYENGLLVKRSSDDGVVEYEYHDNNRIVTIYWGGKEEPGEVNINAIPEVMGNYENLPL